MIRYTLICAHDHEFEIWFRNSQVCDDQLAAGQVSCPFCNSPDVDKALMAPNVVSGRGRDERREKIAAAVCGALAAGEAAGSPAAPPTRPVSEAVPAGGPTEATEKARKMAEIARAIQSVRSHVEATCENVGDRFAEEARMIHYGEADARPIYGSATLRDARELQEEGIACAVLPWTDDVKN